MAFLPCHDERGCDASCCVAFAVWDSWSYNRLLVDFPDIFDRKNAGPIMIAGTRNSFVILPKGQPFEFLSRETIGTAEFITLVNRYEKYRKENPRELRCVFLDDGGRCEIYGHRPKVCQNFGVVSEMPCPKSEKRSYYF